MRAALLGTIALLGTMGLHGCTEPNPCYAPPYAANCPGFEESTNRPDLIAWYRFEEDDPAVGALDSSSNGFDAQCSQVCPERTEGVDGQALLTGERDDVFLTVNVEDAFSPDALTLSAWIRDDRDPDESRMGMFLGKPYLSEGDNSYRFHVRDFDDDGDRDLIFRIGGHSAPEQIVTHDFGDHLGSWTHVAGTWDGTSMTLYVAGVAVGTVPATMIEYDTQPLIIGADLNGFVPDNIWTGGIDEVRIYGRALDSSEIAELAERP